MACLCGGIISDVSTPSATEGWILRDQDREPYEDAIGRDIEAFLDAMRQGQRDEWIGGYFSPVYPTDLSDQSVILDIISLHGQRYLLSIAECEECGRLHVQRAPAFNAYRSYRPDHGYYAAVLRSRRTGSEPHAAEATPRAGDLAPTPGSSLEELVETVRDAPSFLTFAHALAADASGDRRDWRNREIHSYLEASIAWATDSAAAFPTPRDEAGGVWRVFARFLMAGRVYRSSLPSDGER